MAELEKTRIEMEKMKAEEERKIAEKKAEEARKRKVKADLVSEITDRVDNIINEKSARLENITDDIMKIKEE